MNARRVYVGGDDDSQEQTQKSGHAYAKLSGGSLGGLLLDVTGWSPEEREEGALLITDKGLYGPGGRAFYAPGTADIDGPFLWHGDTP
ncbi:hypothetical protein ACWCYZ_44290 [Streptomyces virginiae]